MAQGVSLAISNDFQEELQALRLWDGSPVRTGLQARLQREYALLQVVEEQIRDVEAERREALRNSTTTSVAQVRQRLRRRGIGENSAWLYVMELSGWRQFHNRREIGGLAGLSPTPYQSGDASHDQGIRPAGNGLIRFMAIEIAWSSRPIPARECTKPVVSGAVRSRE